MKLKTPFNVAWDAWCETDPNVWKREVHCGYCGDSIGSIMIRPGVRAWEWTIDIPRALKGVIRTGTCLHSSNAQAVSKRVADNLLLKAAKLEDEIGVNP
jgi:hypothetical protein